MGPISTEFIQLHRGEYLLLEIGGTSSIRAVFVASHWGAGVLESAGANSFADPRNVSGDRDTPKALSDRTSVIVVPGEFWGMHHLMKLGSTKTLRQPLKAAAGLFVFPLFVQTSSLSHI